MKIFLVVLLSISVSSAFGYNTIVEIPQGAIEPGCLSNPCFIPQTIFVEKNTQVTWQNNDYASHSVTSGTSGGGHDGFFDISSLTKTKSALIKFEKTGNFQYFCVFHPWMAGNVVVVEKFPAWMNDIFEWHKSGFVSDMELNNAINFLISKNVFKI